jgi:pyruvate decarboxylase
MLDFFGAREGAAHTHQVRTKDQLEDVLTLLELKNPKGVHVSHPVFEL